MSQPHRDRSERSIVPMAARPTTEVCDANPSHPGAAPALTVVPAEPRDAPEALAQQIRRLQLEARDLARVQAQCLEVALLAVGRLASEVADGGEVYAPAVRNLARRTANDTQLQAQALNAYLAGPEQALRRSNEARPATSPQVLKPPETS